MQADGASLASRASDDTVKQLLDQARCALGVSDAASALQCVVQALQLLRGHNAVIPTLQNAAEQYHAQRAAPMDEISALLSQVTLQAEQQQAARHQSHATAGEQQNVQMQQQPPPQEQCMHPTSSQHDPGWQQNLQHQQQQLTDVHSHQSSQQGMHNSPILEETGRGELASIALREGLYWQCPHCSGVLPQQRQQAHLETWCPVLHRSNSDDMQQ